MRPRIFVLMILCGILFGTAGCNSYDRLLKSNDIVLKLEKAKEFYNKKNYDKALPLFEELVSYYKGTKTEEDIYYFYAYCYYGQGEFLMAQYHFKNFWRQFPDNPRAEESLFMAAQCYLGMSPTYKLDQDYTSTAVDQLQLFINSYPTSARVDSANHEIDNLRNKLAEKDFQNALLYYHTENYKAASLSFKNFTLEFPDASKVEEADFLSFKASYLYAMKSIDTKKPERLEDALKIYQNFSLRYAESEFKKEADKLSASAQNELLKLKTINTHVEN